MSESERVRLNVGGVRFETTLTTIRRIPPDTMLAAMFSGHHTVNTDADGFVFIDRSPTHFEAILNFMRTGSVPIGMPQQGLEAELEYYGLHQAFMAAGGQEMLDPEFTTNTPEYLLLSIHASPKMVSMTVPSTLVDTTLARLQQMLKGASSHGLQWELRGSTLVGTYTSMARDTFHSQVGVNELMLYLFQLISNGDFGSDFRFGLISSSSAGSATGGGSDGKFVNHSVFRRLVPWYKHANIPHAKVPRNKSAGEGGS